MARKSSKFKKTSKKDQLSKKYKKLLPKSLQPHFHQRWEDEGVEITRMVALGVAGQHYGNITFNVNNLEAINELAVLYDNFVLTKAVVYATWTPVLSGAQTNNTDAWAPVLKYFYDYDDDVTPTDSEFRQRNKVKIRQMTPMRKTVKMSITPSILMTGYQGLATSIYIPKFKQKIDMASKNVEHYGIKYALEWPGGINNGDVTFRIKYYLTCYNPR